jgi:hypothetical protein
VQLWGPVLADGLVILAAVFAWRATRHLTRALGQPGRSDSSLRLVRGIRALILAVTALALALGILYESRAVVIIAAVFLAEELYETSVVLLALRHQRHADRGQRVRGQEPGQSNSSPTT